MTISAQLERQAALRPARGAVVNRKPLLQAEKARPEFSTSELAFRVFAALRAHPHISNVLTHISHANWGSVERSLNSILNPATTSARLSPLEQNIVDLMVAERGITGKILKPYFHAILYKLLERIRAERLIRHVETLFLELECKMQHPAPPAPAPIEPFQGPNDVRDRLH